METEEFLRKTSLSDSDLLSAYVLLKIQRNEIFNMQSERYDIDMQRLSAKINALKETMK